ncbi:MAG: hypothetical protein V3V31_16165 [Methylococcales bacterium]
MSQQPDWLNQEDKRAGKLSESGQSVSNPAAPKPKTRNQKSDNVDRSLKGFRLRVDYQQRFDTLVAEQKHISGKKGPDLIEEALAMLFKKYKKL